MVFYVLLGALVLYAARRGGRSSGEFYDDYEKDSPLPEVSPELEEDDLPPPVTYTDDDDDLELLDELEDL